MSQPSKLMSLTQAGVMPLTGLEEKFARMSSEDEHKRLQALKGLSEDDANLLRRAMTEGEGMLMLAEEAGQMGAEAREREAKQAEEIQIRLMKATNAALKAETNAYERYYDQANEAINFTAKAKAKEDAGDRDIEEWIKI